MDPLSGIVDLESVLWCSCSQHSLTNVPGKNILCPSVPVLNVEYKPILMVLSTDIIIPKQFFVLFNYLNSNVGHGICSCTTHLSVVYLIIFCALFNLSVRAKTLFSFNKNVLDWITLHLACQYIINLESFIIQFFDLQGPMIQWRKLLKSFNNGLSWSECLI